MRKIISIIVACISASIFFAECTVERKDKTIKWRHLSTANGDLSTPFTGKDQTSSIVLDVDKDEINDFIITERSQAPSVVWWRRCADGWTTYIIEDTPVPIAAGSDYSDIDGDGDLDIVAGGAWVNEVWWWENPYPNFDPDTPWKRRIIKNFGGKKQHDQLFGDFDSDGKEELAIWNQGGHTLYIAEIPEKPHNAESWKCTAIYTYDDDSEMEQRGRYPNFKGVNMHEGLAKADIDGDSKLDLIAGGHWFKHIGGSNYTANIIDASYQFTRAAAGQLIKGGRQEVILVVGDGWAPMMMYEWQEGTWVGKELLGEVDCGHSLAIIDFNSDGNLDIWNAEMRLEDGNPDAKNLILLGDGKGNFEIIQVSSGIALHESKIADLDGDGDYDILGKPYRWKTPRLDIWINE